MKRLIPLALAAILPLSALSAQSMGVFPQDNELIDANTSDNLFPLSWSAPSRQMMVYDADIPFGMGTLQTGVPLPDGAMITEIGFRRNSGSNSSGRQVKFQIWMADAALLADNVSSTFANNIFPGTDVMVFDGFTALPDLNAGTTEFWIPLDTPFQFDASRGLVVDFRTEINSNSNNAFNYTIDVANSNGFISDQTEFGVGCAGSGGNVPRVTMDSTRVGGNLVVRFTRGTANTPLAIHLNLERLMAPITDPAIAGPCQLWIVPLAVAGGMTNSSGNRNESIPVPNDLSLKGLEIFGQGFIADFFANPLGAVSSNAASTTLGVRPQSSLIRTTGTLPANGGVARNWAPVTLLKWN